MHNTTALAAYFLAPPKPTPDPTSLAAQWHYALQSWTPGGMAILGAIFGVFFILVLYFRRRSAGSGQQ